MIQFARAFIPNFSFLGSLEVDIEWSFKLFLRGWVGGGWVLRMNLKLLKVSTKLKLKLKLKFGN